MKILIVDDEPEIIHQLKNALECQLYMVDTALDGEEALDKIFDNAYDLILLDIMLPKVDGLTLLSEIRKGNITTPVLMLTARDSVEDKIKGLDSGADDYLAKPFSIAELMARTRSILRRISENRATLLTVGDIALDTVSRKITVKETPVDMTLKEFSIFEFLIYNKGRVVSRFDLAEHVWGNDFDPFSMSNFIDVHIKNIRKKLGDDNHIRTVRGIGFIIDREQ